MESQYYYIEKLKITNFLSFFGYYEVDLLPFTAITCNYTEGKEDMIRAIEFVFGANLDDILIENPKSLVHKALWKEYDAGKDTECFVEVTVNLVSEKENITFYRGVKNCKVEHKINSEIVPLWQYEEWLNDLYLNIKNKNIILHKSFFNNAIWGTPEDLEMVITKILRLKSCSSEWKKAMAKLEELLEAASSCNFEKMVQKMKKSHAIVEKFVKHFNTFVKKRNYLLTSIAEEASLEISEPSSVLTSLGNIVADKNFNSEKMQMLHDKYESMLDNYKNLEIKENELQWEMYLLELKISSNPQKNHIWQERITALKEKSIRYEELTSSLWAKGKEIDRQLHKIAFEISTNLALLRDLERSYYLKNRLTQYGRLIDYIQPNNLLQLLQKILGENILYGNLCDDMKTAVSCLEHLKTTGYEGRETFIIFENYSPQFKDLVLATAEDGIFISSIQDMMIFLCKLKEYGLVAKVPVISENRFNFELREEIYYANDIIYPEDGIFLNTNGIISYCYETESNTETDTDIEMKIETILDRTNQLMIEQELKYEEYTSLMLQRSETLQKMIFLENDILLLKKFQRPKPRLFIVHQELPLPDVYNEYLNNFKPCDRSIEVLEEDLFSSEEFVGDVLRTSSFLEDQTAQIEDALNSIRTKYKDTAEEKTKVKSELKKLEKELRLSRVFSNKVWFGPVRKHFLSLQSRKTCSYYYDMELKKCRELMTTDEMNEFEGWKDWRMETINSIGKNLTTDPQSLKTMKREVDDLTMTRKRTLIPLLEYCNLNLSSAINFVMDTSLPFLHLKMDTNGLQLLSSLSENTGKIIELGHFNTFVKFLVGLSLFLEIANYDNVPLLLLDNLQEFLPIHKDSYEAVLEDGTLNRVDTSTEIINFQIITKIAQYLNYFIEKNKHKNNIRENKKKGTYGPVQIIYFTSDDLVHAAQCHLWIRHNLLPDEYISEKCDSYSAIEEIQFE